jgi:hypothetical protein
MRELIEIFATKIYIKTPIIDSAQLQENLDSISRHGIDSSASSCLIAVVCALAAIWGNFPEDDVREATFDDDGDISTEPRMSLSVPDHRIAESLLYLELARKRMSAAHLDNTLVSVQCFALLA